MQSGSECHPERSEGTFRRQGRVPRCARDGQCAYANNALLLNRSIRAVSRPDRVARSAVRPSCTGLFGDRAATARRFDIHHFLRDGPNAAMKWLVDFTTTIFRWSARCQGCGTAPAPRLRPLGDQHHLHAPDPDRRTVAQRNLRRTEALPGIALQSRNLTRASTGAPEPGPISPPNRSANFAPSTGIEADAHDDRVPDRSETGILDLASIRWRRMSVLSDGAPPPALSAGWRSPPAGR